MNEQQGVDYGHVKPTVTTVIDEVVEVKSPTIDGVGVEPQAYTGGAHDLYIGGDAEPSSYRLRQGSSVHVEEATNLDTLLDGIRAAGRRVLGFRRVGQHGSRAWQFKVMR